MSQGFTKPTIREILTANGQSVLDDTLDKVKVSNATAADLNVTEASGASIATNTSNSATSLGVIDDWDETDRCKVNPIVGQAGVAAGAGTAGATVQRVVIVTDQTSIPVTDNSSSLTVDNAGTFAVQATVAASATNIAKAEDAASASTDVGVPAMAIRKATPANTSDADGDYEMLQMSAGRLWTSATIDAALPTGANVIGALTANQSVNTAQINGVAPSMGNGASGTGVQRVTIASDSTGTVAVTQSTASSLNAQVVGSIAHDGVDSGNPVKIGMKAVAHGSNPTAVAAADRSDWYCNRHGIPFTIGGHPNIITAEYNTTTSQTDDPIIDSISSGTKIVITQIDVTIDNSTTTTVGVRVGFGASTLTAAGASGAVAVNGIVFSHPGMASGSGMVKGNGSGTIGIGADGEELRITCDTPTSGELRVLVTYFTIES